MQAELRSWLINAGFPEHIDLAAMHRGLGSTDLWSFVPSPRQPALVVRVFPAGGDATAGREYLAMNAAARHGLPVPAIVRRGAIGNRPVLVSTFVEGVMAIQLLTTEPDAAFAVGRAMGETMGRLHEVAAPDGLTARHDAWIARGGQALAPVRSLLETVPNQDRLLHLDFHPRNVLMRDSRVSGVIDWENTTAGPPHMDLARTRAILRAAMLGNIFPAAQRDAFTKLELGLIAGHTAVAGADPHPDLSATWGLAMTVDDLAGHLGKPNTFVTPSLLEQLATERDASIRDVLAANPRSLLT